MANEPDKPKKKIDRALAPETHAERKIKSTFTEADILACKQFVSSMTKPGAYLVKKTVKKISAGAVKKLFGINNGNN